MPNPLERKLKREQAARKAAEALLEQKSLELYQSNKSLTYAVEKLERQSAKDMEKFEFEEHISEALIQYGRLFLTRSIDDSMLHGFVRKLSDTPLINDAYLSISSEHLDSRHVGFWGSQSLHDLVLQLNHLKGLVWYDNVLILSLEVGEENFGLLAIEAINAETHQTLLETGYQQIVDLICSAINRQIMADKTEQARIRAENSEQATQEFLAMINHELRTPLNGLLGNADLLSQTSLSKDQLAHLEHLRQSGGMLKAIINDLLDFSKMNAGMLEIFPINFQWQSISDLIESVFSEKAKQKQIDFSLTTSPLLPECLYGDSDRICQILVNLVGNAVKFTESGGVEVLFEWNDKTLGMTVKDSGIGMTEVEQQEMFSPFMQANRRANRRFEGTGLGLSICKTLVELMGGTIHVRSELGKGTQVKVELPMEQGESAKHTAIQEEPVSLRDFSSLAILVVDDIVMNQLVIRKMLEKLAITPEFANNGKEALNCVAQKSFDLIFMDCRMPEMDGFEATRCMREQGLDLPIIALTAGTTSAEKQQCMDSGMDDFLSKPYTAEDLSRVLNKWLDVN